MTTPATKATTSPTYSAESVSKAISASRYKVSKGEAKLIHALLKGRY